MVDFAQPRVHATAATELWLCSNPMARPRSSVDNRGMFGCFEKFCFYTLIGRSSEIVMPHEILKKISNLHVQHAKRHFRTPRQVRTHAHVKINFDNAKVCHGIQVKIYYDNFSIYVVFEK